MKTYTAHLIALSMAFSSIGLTACEDDDTVIIVSREVSQEDAQELMANILSYETYGLVAQFDRIGDEVLESAECDVPTTDTATASGGLVNYTYDYAFSEAYTLFCDAGLLLQYDLTGQQDIDALTYDAQHVITLAFQTTGLEESAEDEVYDGAYDRSGDWRADRSGETYDFTYDSTVEDVRVAKDSNKIVGGTSTFTLTQTYSRANVSYTYTGTVVFLNEDLAEVTFGDGASFVVDLLDVSIAD